MKRSVDTVSPVETKQSKQQQQKKLFNQLATPEEKAASAAAAAAAERVAIARGLEAERAKAEAEVVGARRARREEQEGEMLRQGQAFDNKLAARAGGMSTEEKDR